MKKIFATAAASLCMVCGADSGSLYYTIDVSGGPNAAIFPVSTLDAAPGGGWTDEYKTTKIVLRRIEPGTFSMCTSRTVTISKPYYIGVFEVTQKQYELVTGKTPANYLGDMRPVDCVSYSTLRGFGNGSKWPRTSQVDASTFIGILREKTGLESIDLPTEAQWEYACRAGTSSAYNNGGNSESDLASLGRYAGNTGDGAGGLAQHTVVGSYAPNAWGLYDMHGNVWEWCLDGFAALQGGTDPLGTANRRRRTIRGGSWFADAGYCSSLHREACPFTYGFDVGLRLRCAPEL